MLILISNRRLQEYSTPRGNSTETYLNPFRVTLHFTNKCLKESFNSPKYFIFSFDQWGE
jgi:hypothetical protein